MGLYFPDMGAEGWVPQLPPFRRLVGRLPPGQFRDGGRRLIVRHDVDLLWQMVRMGEDGR